MSGISFLHCTLVTARLGGYPAGHRVHPGMLELAARLLKKEEGDILIDSYVFRCGDAVAFLLTHRGKEEIDTLVGAILGSCRDYMGKKKISSPASAPISSCCLSFQERESEEIVVFLSDLPTVDLYNHHLYRIFGDPFSTTRLVLDECLLEGFVFTTSAGKSIIDFSLPEDTYRLLASIRRPKESRVYMVRRRDGEPAASVAIPFGVGAPGLLLRSGGVFPTYGEAAEPFAQPFMVRSSGIERPMMPLLPVSLCDAQGSRSGGPPRVICLAFTIAGGRLIGPADIFDDPALDQARQFGSRIAGYARAHGPFDPFV
ncbi:fructose 1,6-bisphosphatase [Methanocalculus taiwanensis]|uniref:Fructose-1,6-bisphosphate aldolase/phosphatase n=1 Tax=Methanocalculus taiwanensis TaxID=106207 RepID=A0ABD4TP07_9EURY|nr:fructose 1,6-bisphosphatase [Methanocalculus taiwanensis]MCQ1539493.1 fructose 1,6-bisphosphatase [Methanocalculus taiwanensis]